ERANYVPDPAGHIAEVALTRFAREPTRENAQDYARALLPVIRQARHAGGPTPPQAVPDLPETRPISGVQPTRVLGSGAEGLALAGYDLDTGEPRVVKLNAGGEPLVGDILCHDPHPHIATIYAGGSVSVGRVGRNYSVRELCDETLAE